MNATALALAAAALSSAQTVRIGVFGLFHPTELVVRPGSPVALRIEGPGSAARILEGSQTLTLRLASDGPGPFRISSAGVSGDIILSVPGKIERRFRGKLTIRAHGGEWLAVVEMDREVAVASIVAAEMSAGVPQEALRAQAVATRSFLAASVGRHQDFEFCDTTHCQFMRAWPDPSTGAFQATASTAGLILFWRGRAFPAQYHGACGGHTREAVSGGYSYKQVQCDYCQRHPSEPARGHQLGLCQTGGIGMAKAGADFRRILDWYYPGTEIRQAEAASMPPATKVHTSVSGFHSGSPFGDEDTIERNMPTIIKSAITAPIHISESHLSRELLAR